MLAPFPVTASRTPRPTADASAAVKPSRSKAGVWGARLVQMILAVYLLPVLLLVLVIGGLGMVLVGVVALTGRLMGWMTRSDESEFAEGEERP